MPREYDDHPFRQDDQRRYDDQPRYDNRDDRFNGTRRLDDDRRFDAGSTRRIDDRGTLRREDDLQQSGYMRRQSRAAAGFQEGDKVIALFKGRGSKWYPGVISRVNSNGTYDIRYADGDSEVDALERNVKLDPDANPTSPRRGEDRHATGRREAGELAGPLLKLRSALLRVVNRRDGDAGQAALLGALERFDASRGGECHSDDFAAALQRLGVDDRDVGPRELQELEDLYPGRRRGDINYRALVRALELDEDFKGSRGGLLREGMKVEARYRGKSRYYTGVIKRANRDGTYDIDYDDGEKEMDVGASLIRELEDLSGSRRGGRDDSRERDRPRRSREESPPTDGVTLIARALRNQLWEWARGFGKSGGKTREALHKVFRAIDKGDTGSVPRTDMASLLVKKMKLRVAQADVDLLLDCMDVEGNGLISYEEFVDFCCHQPEGHELGVLHAIVSSALRRSGHDLLQLCQRYDDKKRGTVKAAELKKVLNKIGAMGDDGLRSSDLAELVSRFAYGNNKDDVDYDLFVLWVLGGKDLRKAEMRVRTSLQRLVSMGLDYQSMFALMDRDGSGFLDAKEFRSTLSRLGLMLTESEMRGLFHKYSGSTSSGGARAGVRYADFLELANDDIRDLRGRMALVAPKAREALGDWVQQHGGAVLRRAFAKADKSQKGSVAVRDFDQVVLKHKTLLLPKNDLDQLRSCFEIPAPSSTSTGSSSSASAFGGVDYGSFVEFGQHVPENEACVELHEKLSKAASKEKPGSLEAALMARASSETGAVSIRSCDKVLESRLRLDLSARDFKCLHARLDPSGREDIDPLYLLHWLASASPEGLASSEHRCGLGLRQLSSLGRDPLRPFRALDRSGKGILPMAEFSEAMEVLGLLLGPHEVHALAHKFDTSGSSSASSDLLVDYVRFIARAKDAAIEVLAPRGALGGGEASKSGSASSSSAACLLPPSLRSQLWAWYKGDMRADSGAMLDAFKKEDRLSNGKISAQAFERVTATKLRMRLSKADTKTLCRALDLDGSGQLRYGDFVEFVSYQPEPSDDDALAELQSRLNDTLACNEANTAGSNRTSAIKSGGESKYDQSRDSDDLPSSASDAPPVPPRVVLTAFHRRDPDRAGRVTASVFRRVLSDDLSIECSGPELRDLEDRFDLGLDSMSSKGNNNNTSSSSLSRVEDQVRYDLFARWVCAGHKVSTVERRVKRSLQCLVAHPANKGKTTFLTRAFEAVIDVQDRDGTVNLREFINVVRKLGLFATEGEIRALGKAYELPAMSKCGRDTGTSFRDVLVDWRRFTALAEEGSARPRRGEEEEDVPEGELAAEDGDVAALAFSVRSRVRTWSKKHPGELAAYVVGLLHDSGVSSGSTELAKSKGKSSSRTSSSGEEGMLSAKQLRGMLKACGNVRLASADDDAALAACFDPNSQSGDASIDLLVDFLFPPPLLSELDVSLGSGMRRRLRAKAQTPADLKLLFTAADRKAHSGPDKKGTGYLPRQTFKKCLLKADDGLAPDEIAALEAAFGDDDNDDGDGSGGGRGRHRWGSSSESDSFISERSDDSSGDERHGQRRSKKTTRGRPRSGSAGGGGGVWGMWGRSSEKQESEVCWLRVVAWLEAANATKVVSRCRLGLAARLSRGGSAASIFDKASSRHGRLERVELEALLSSQGVVLSEAQSDALWQHLDREEVGYLDEKAFAQLCGDLSKGRSSGATTGRDLDNDRAALRDMDPADLWMSDWLSELRYSLEASFEAIWQQFDSDGNGELDTHELDHLVAEMLKAMDPESEPTKHQVKEVKGRIGVGGGGGSGQGRRGRNPRGVDKGTLRVGLLDFIEDEFRERLGRGEVGNGAVAAWADCAGLFAAVDTNGDGTVTHAEFTYVLCHRLKLLTRTEAIALARAIDVDRDGTVSVRELRRALDSARADLQDSFEVQGSSSRRRNGNKRAESSSRRDGSSGSHHGSALMATTLGVTPVSLTPEARRALLKLNAGVAPRPEDFLSLATLAGASSSWQSVASRPSHLAKLDGLPGSKLGNAISGRNALRTVSHEATAAAAQALAIANTTPSSRRGSSKPSSSSAGAAAAATSVEVEVARMMTLLHLKRAEGIPCPPASQLAGHDGNHDHASTARGVRVCLFYADIGHHTAHDCIVGNMCKTAAETAGVPPSSASGKSGRGGKELSWLFRDEPEDGAVDARLLLTADPLLVQEDLDLMEPPDLKRKLFALIELTVVVKRPKAGASNGNTMPPVVAARRSKSTDRKGRRSKKKSGATSSDDDSIESGSSGSSDEEQGRRRNRRSKKKGEIDSNEEKEEEISDKGEEKDNDSGSEGGEDALKKKDKKNGAKSKIGKKGAAESLSSDEDSQDELNSRTKGSKTQYETVEVSCGWVKVLFAELCKKKRDLTFELRHGNPWGTEPGEPLPEEDLAQQATLRHQIRDAMPNTLGALVGKRRKATLTFGCNPVKEAGGWTNASSMDEVRLRSYKVLPKSAMLEVFGGLPRNAILPVGGTACASLSLFSAYATSLRNGALGRRASSMQASPLLALLPQMVNDSAVRAALLGAWASVYYARLTEFISSLHSGAKEEGHSNSNSRGVLEALLPVLEQLVADFWIVSKSSEKFLPPSSSSSSGAYEHHYIGGYNTLREDTPESHAALNARTQRIVQAYKTLIAARNNERLPTRKAPAAGASTLTQEAGTDENAFTMHAPFYTRELKFRVNGDPSLR